MYKFKDEFSNSRQTAFSTNFKQQPAPNSFDSKINVNTSPFMMMWYICTNACFDTNFNLQMADSTFCWIVHTENVLSSSVLRTRFDSFEKHCWPWQNVTYDNPAFVGIIRNRQQNILNNISSFIAYPKANSMP